MGIILSGLKHFWVRVTNSVQCVENEVPIHGIKQVITPNRHPIEYLLWILSIGLALAGTVVVSSDQWRRYVDSPTVVALEKDHRNWNATLPAVTACYEDRLEETVAEDIIERIWAVYNDSDDKFPYYMEYLTTITNITYNNLHVFKRFKDDETINKINMFDLAQALHPNYSALVIVYDVGINMSVVPVITELGVCYTFNSAFGGVQSIERVGKNKPTALQAKPVTCSFANRLCYARIDVDGSAVRYHIHSPYELMNGQITSTQFLNTNDELTMILKVLETSASGEVRNVSPSQRKCFFPDEPADETMAIYSASLCHMQCRMNLALALCGCRPFFYYFIGKSEPICSPNGLACLAAKGWPQSFSKTNHKCACVRPCTELLYSSHSQQMTKWDHNYGELPFGRRASFRWELLPPKVKLKRYVVFGWEDLIVSFGGALGLFLGCSFLSVFEVFYVTARFIYQQIHNRISPIRAPL